MAIITESIDIYCFSNTGIITINRFSNYARVAKAVNVNRFSNYARVAKAVNINRFSNYARVAKAVNVNTALATRA
jgi:hypothetical protein